MTPAAPVAAAFRERTGRDPDGVWAAPGRVNLIGEHTDYNDGFALPFAIDRGVTAAVALRDDGRLRLCSAQEGGPVELPVGERPAGWAAYPAGAVAVTLAAAGAAGRGADVCVDGDLPAGSGLSSSAALCCAVVLAVAQLAGLDIPRERLARLAQQAETDFAGVPVGVMDQVASLLGVDGHALLLDARSLAVEPVPCDPAAAGAALLVVDTRAPRRLADGAYAQRRAACAEAARLLGVPGLRDATAADLDRLPHELRPLARHVVTEDERVLAAAELLRAGRLAEVGPLLDASHESLRGDYAVSCRELDSAVDAARAAGALGARMTGAGFGGCAVALVPAGRQDDVAAAVTAAATRQGLAVPRCFSVRPSAGARRLA